MNRLAHDLPEPDAAPPRGFFAVGDRVVHRATGAKATVQAVDGDRIQIQYDGSRGKRGAWHTVNAATVRHED